MVNGLLTDFSGGYVDDLVRSGDKHFKELSKWTGESFEVAEGQELAFTFAGFFLRRDLIGYIVRDQHVYLNNLPQLPPNASISGYRSTPMKLARLANTQPDCQFNISKFVQVTKAMFETGKRPNIKPLTIAVSYAVENRVLFGIPKLHDETICIVVYCDASFDIEVDLPTQLGHIRLPCWDTGAAGPVNFNSNEEMGITRSAIAGEVISFSAMCDGATKLLLDLEIVFKKRVPVQMYKDRVE